MAGSKRISEEALNVDGDDKTLRIGIKKFSNSPKPAAQNEDYAKEDIWRTCLVAGVGCNPYLVGL
jgi:hypothetical protein